MVRSGQIISLARQHWRVVVIELGINVILPFVVYSLVSPRSGDVAALIASSAPPIIWSLVEFARARRVDALSIFVLVGIVLSLLAFIGGGGPRFLQLREKLATGLVGLAFLGSAAIGRPLMYEIAKAGMARRQNTAAAARFERLKDDVRFRRSMTLMTVVWGFGLILDTMVSAWLIFVITIREYLIVNPILGYATMGALGIWTFWFSRRAQKRNDAIRAAEAAAQGRGA